MMSRGGDRIEDLPAPAGVDPYLYAALAPDQKMQLHHRSQMMMQVSPLVFPT